jgi:hypothetical protein
MNHRFIANLTRATQVHCLVAASRARDEAIMHRPAQMSRKATLSSDKEAPSDVAAYCTQDGIKAKNKRRKKCCLGTMTMTRRGDDRGWEAGGSGVGQVSTVVHGNRCLVRPPTNHFKMLLEKACPNHAYLIKHKLKDCGMMQSFITSGSLTWGAELDEGTDGSDIALFPEKNATMTVFEGRPPWERHRMSSVDPRIPIHGGWGRGGSRV